MRPFLLILFMSFLFTEYSYNQDWAELSRYRSENEKIKNAVSYDRIVFMGNSITEGWTLYSPFFKENHNYINRGISGQTSPQMLLRFRSDVIDLHPEAVVILSGINDIAGNTGPSTLQMIMDNIISMAELAKANNIDVILCSVLPAYDFPWNPGLEPAMKIVALNKMIKKYAIENQLTFVDYFSAMVDDKNGLKAEYSEDGVHPNTKGYSIMEPLVNKAIKKVISKSGK
ncbi:MAG: SGNH/GDSL hydrolase family protein [Saprospiraceae bacterium]|nr:SGNH/GDSL hydrolase family protein [Saprospiraceae bacterium]